jgi:hypothetical protein
VTGGFSSIRGRLARLVEAMPAHAQLPPGFVDPITAHLRAHIAAGETPTPTTPEVRTEAEALVSTWLARGTVRA